MALRTRNLKVWCEHCGYTLRTTRKHLAEWGPPICPCRGDVMFSDYAAELEEQSRGPAATVTTLRDRVVTTNTVHTCTSCHDEVQRQDWLRHITVRVGTEFITQKLCLACDARRAGNSDCGGLARA